MSNYRNQKSMRFVIDKKSINKNELNEKIPKLTLTCSVKLNLSLFFALI